MRYTFQMCILPIVHFVYVVPEIIKTANKTIENNTFRLFLTFSLRKNKLTSG